MASFRSQTFDTDLQDTNGYFPEWEDDGSSVVVRAFIGGSKKIDVQIVKAVIQTMTIPVRSTSDSVIPALQSMLGEDNIGVGTLVDDRGRSFDNVSITKVAVPSRQPYAAEWKATVTFTRAAP